MILDHENQRGALLQLIDTATVPGRAVEVVAALKAAIAAAKVAQPENKANELKKKP